MQATQWRHRVYAHIVRTPLGIPVFGAALLAALWLALVGRLDAERDAAVAAAMRHTEAAATAFAEHTRRELRDIDRTASLVKAQFEPDGIVNLPYLIRNRLLPLDGPARISLTDRAGNVIATTGELRATVNVADSDYFRRHRERDTGTLDVAQPMPDPNSGQPSIAMTRRLNRGDGSFAGIVIVSIAPGYFVDYYRESELGRQGLLAVIGTDGTYRARRAGDHVAAAPDASATPLFAAASAKDEGSYIGASVIDATRRLVAYRKLPDYPLIVAAAQAEDEVLADFAKRRRAYLAAGAIASLAIVVFFATNTVLVFRARRSAREVRRQRTFLQALIDNIPMGLVVRSMAGGDRGRVMVWNPAAECIFGVPAAAALGRPMAEVVAQEFAAGMENRDRALLASPMVQNVPQAEADVPHRGRRVFSMVRAPIFDETGDVEYVVSIIHDATDEQARMEELRLNAQVFETTADAIVLCDAHDRVIAVNAAFSKLTGFAPGDMLGTALVDTPFGSADPPEELAARQEQRAKDGCVMAEVLRYRKDGSELPCWLTKTCVRDETGRVVNYVRVYTDISRLKAAQHELERLASVDALTGLLNRRMFHDRLGRALKRAQRTGKSVGLLFIDLDAFKRINDTHGHAAGDSVLKEIARRLQRCVRASDSLCRIGGDEFTIVMEDARLPRDAEVVAQRIARELESPFTVAGQPVSCHASIGIALYPDDGANAEMLQYLADSAMYRAKRAAQHGCALPATSSGHDTTALAVAAR